MYVGTFSYEANMQRLHFVLKCRKVLNINVKRYAHTQSNLKSIKMSQLLNVEHGLKHLFDGSENNMYSNQILNLGVGAPGEDLLKNCCTIFQQATAHRLQIELDTNHSMLFQYGAVSGPLETRQAIAKYLTQMYNDPVKAEDLFITTGATQGLHFLMTTLIDLNGIVFVDEYTYMIALDAIKQFTTLRIIPVHLQNDGVHIKNLESLLKEYQFQSATKTFWAMYYTIPAYHNPTGIVFSEAICKSLIQLARSYNIGIICDDVYNLLNYATNRSAPKRLFAFDNNTDVDFRGHVVSNGSFSKIIAPGLRLGWIEAPASIKTILDNSGTVVSSGCFNNYTAGVVASLFELNLAQAHIQKLYDAYKERMLAAIEVLDNNLPNGCNMIRPNGGYFIWISLPENMNAAAFREICLAEENIFFITGERFAIQKHIGKNCLRLSIAFHNKPKLIDGLERFCAALKHFIRR